MKTCSLWIINWTTISPVATVPITIHGKSRSWIQGGWTKCPTPCRRHILLLFELKHLNTILVKYFLLSHWQYVNSDSGDNGSTPYMGDAANMNQCWPSSMTPCGVTRPRLINSSPLDEMAAFSQTIFSDAFSWMKSFFIVFKISLKCVLNGPVDNNPAKGQIMACRRIGDKPLSEPMLTRFTDTYMLHKGEMR